MYLPDHFKETSPEAVATLIRDCPLATVVAQTSDGLVANHIPLLQAGEGVLIGHIAAANDMHRLISEQQEILAIFRGEDSYISPNLYPSKAEHHRHVPTWNYQVAHVHGRISFQHDEKTRRAVVGLLTRQHERRVNGDAGWRMADSPADFMAAMLEGIVALRIEITRVIAKSKLSQNREARDHASVTEAMQAGGRNALAKRMRDFAEERDLD